MGPQVPTSGILGRDVVLSQKYSAAELQSLEAEMLEEVLTLTPTPLPSSTLRYVHDTVSNRIKPSAFLKDHAHIACISDGGSEAAVTAVAKSSLSIDVHHPTDHSTVLPFFSTHVLQNELTLTLTANIGAMTMRWMTMSFTSAA